MDERRWNPKEAELKVHKYYAAELGITFTPSG
jgi:hypothetical protein